MPNVFPPAEVEEAARKFGHTAVQAIRSGGRNDPRTGSALVARGEIEGIIFSLLNLRVTATPLVLSLQFRAVPFRYPESFPTFYLVSPRSFRLIPEVYKNNKPQPAIALTADQERDDPRRVGWDIGGEFARVHFCQLEEIWNARPLHSRRLGWALTQLRGLLENPTRARFEGARVA